ncbi:hypothetical protein [Staphylococcus pseudintermedius]|uniref:hypothetical protein n=1 Tax=Staphylococcus pseudintermedius TaxID=283734 RepID=UPI003F74C07F
MEKEKMLSIANKLNLYLAISEVHGFVQFWIQLKLMMKMQYLINTKRLNLQK